MKVALCIVAVYVLVLIPSGIRMRNVIRSHPYADDVSRLQYVVLVAISPLLILWGIFQYIGDYFMIGRSYD